MSLKNLVYNSIIQIGGAKEKFSNEAVKNMNPYEQLWKMSSIEMIATIITVLLIYALLLIFGKFLCNNYLVKFTTLVKPVKNIWTILAISVLFKLLF